MSNPHTRECTDGLGLRKPCSCRAADRAADAAFVRKMRTDRAAQARFAAQRGDDALAELIGGDEDDLDDLAIQTSRAAKLSAWLLQGGKDAKVLRKLRAWAPEMEYAGDPARRRTA
jgi:hypothetical protein